MHVARYNLGPLDNNMYLIGDEATHDAVIVDPTFESRATLSDILAGGWHISTIVNTHGHLDHIYENAWFVANTGAPLVVHQADMWLLDGAEEQALWLGFPAPQPCTPTGALVPGSQIVVGSRSLRVVHTPGHSAGSVTLVGADFVVSGDVLFAGSVGRTDLPQGDAAQLMSSIAEHLLTLPDSTTVYPGHGEPTTIGRERTSNPYLREAVSVSNLG